MLVEIIPCGEKREILCGPPNITRIINMTPGTTYIFVCADLGTPLGAFLCGGIPTGNIVFQRVPLGVQIVLICNCA